MVDEMFRTDELNQYLSRMNLTPRWEDGIFDRLVSGEVTGEEPVQPRKGCRIWQLKKDVDVAMRFIGYEDQVRKFGEPDAGNYTLVRASARQGYPRYEADQWPHLFQGCDGLSEVCVSDGEARTEKRLYQIWESQRIHALHRYP